LEQEREHALQAVAGANRELEVLNEQLRQAADDQAQFLAVTAHELRTPSGCSGGSADILSKHLDELSAEERAELIGAMVSSTGRLRRLVDDLLTAARLDANALEMRVESVRVRDVLDQAIAVVSRAHPARDPHRGSPRR
jgi:K+-sensing histidine kinase KdpD